MLSFEWYVCATGRAIVEVWGSVEWSVWTLLWRLWKCGSGEVGGEGVGESARAKTTKTREIKFEQKGRPFSVQ